MIAKADDKAQTSKQLLKQNREILSKIKPCTLEDKAFGCILGAFVGDSCGSYNEFARELATKEFMDECMTMPGGGPWDVGPGQVTDDSEMAMCLMSGLIKANENKSKDEERVLDENELAKSYVEWFQSKPFGMGVNTSSSMWELEKVNLCPVVGKKKIAEEQI